MVVLRRFNARTHAKDSMSPLKRWNILRNTDHLHEYYLVYWANSCCASLGVYVVHGALCNQLDLSDGLDWVME